MQAGGGGEEGRAALGDGDKNKAYLMKKSGDAELDPKM